MTIDARSSLILLATLILGIAIGALGAGALAQRRVEHLRELRHGGIFLEHMERIIQPRDEAQWETIRPIIEETGRRNLGLIEGTHARLEAQMDSMRARLAPHLDEDQRARLEARAHFHQRFGPPPHRRRSP